jgi:hypothetical protein
MQYNFCQRLLKERNMKNKIFTFFVSCFLAITGKAQVIYGELLNDIDNNTVQLQSFSNSKIVFILLPLSASDSLAGQVKSYAIANPAVKVIGVISEDDGYLSSMKTAIKTLYSGSGILLTEGMKTRKGANQSALMNWLSDKEKNQHFNVEPAGIGFKYLISESGKLYAVLPKSASFTSPVFSRLINAAVQ